VDGPRVVVPLATLPVAGRYTAAYRVIAADGDPVTGEIDFVVASVPAPAASPTHRPSPAASATAPAPTASSPSPAAAAAADDGGFPAWAVVLVVGGVVLLGGGTAAWLALRRTRP
jgi:hypothetical protein